MTKPPLGKPYRFDQAADPRPATRALHRSDVPPAQARPKVSILVLTLNGAALIERMIASFAVCNTYPDVEFVVIEHGSTDDTIARLDALAGTPPIRIVQRGANFSFSNSCNKAARFAQGDLLLFANNDLVFDSDVLPGMVTQLTEAVSGVGLKLYGDAPISLRQPRLNHIGVRYLWSLDDGLILPFNAKPSPNDGLLATRPAVFPAVTAALFLCRKSDFEAAGGFDEGYHYGLEDVDLCLSLRRATGRPVISANHLAAFHGKNATQNTVDPELRARQRRGNIRRLFERFGDDIATAYFAALGDDDGSFHGRPFIVGLAGATTASPTAIELFVHRLARANEWATRFLPDASPVDAANLDILVVRDGGPPPVVSGAFPHLAVARLDADLRLTGFDLAPPGLNPIYQPHWERWADRMRERFATARSSALELAVRG